MHIQSPCWNNFLDRTVSHTLPVKQETAVPGKKDFITHAVSVLILSPKDISSARLSKILPLLAIWSPGVAVQKGTGNSATV